MSRAWKDGIVGMILYRNFLYGYIPGPGQTVPRSAGPTIAEQESGDSDF